MVDKTRNETQATIWHVPVGNGSGVLSTEALRLQVDYSGQGSPCMFPRYHLFTAEVYGQITSARVRVHATTDVETNLVNGDIETIALKCIHPMISRARYA